MNLPRSTNFSGPHDYNGAAINFGKVGPTEHPSSDPFLTAFESSNVLSSPSFRSSKTQILKVCYRPLQSCSMMYDVKHISFLRKDRFLRVNGQTYELTPQVKHVWALRACRFLTH
jgi:hypothetical protein